MSKEERKAKELQRKKDMDEKATEKAERERQKTLLKHVSIALLQFFNELEALTMLFREISTTKY